MLSCNRHHLWVWGWSCPSLGTHRDGLKPGCLGVRSALGDARRGDVGGQHHPPTRLKCGDHLLILPAKAEIIVTPDVNEGKLWLFFSLVVWLEGEEAPVSPGAAGLQSQPPEEMRAALGAQWRVYLGPNANSSLPRCVGAERANEGKEIARFQLLTDNLHRSVSNRNTMALSNGKSAAASSCTMRCEISSGVFFSCNRCFVLRCLAIPHEEARKFLVVEQPNRVQTALGSVVGALHRAVGGDAKQAAPPLSNFPSAGPVHTAWPVASEQNVMFLSRSLW